MYRLVKRDLGLGKRMDEGAGGGDATDEHTLSHIQEAWIAHVFLPALDRVGWHR